MKPDHILYEIWFGRSTGNQVNEVNNIEKRAGIFYWGCSVQTVLFGRNTGNEVKMRFFKSLSGLCVLYASQNPHASCALVDTLQYLFQSNNADNPCELWILKPLTGNIVAWGGEIVAWNGEIVHKSGNVVAWSDDIIASCGDVSAWSGDNIASCGDVPSLSSEIIAM